jgi:hypothetical protein
MSKLFCAPYVEQNATSARQIQSILQMYRQDLLTGVMITGYPTGEELFFLFAKGRGIAIYSVSAVKVERYQPSSVSGLIADRGDGNIRTLPLSPQTLRLAKILIEQNDRGETRTAKTSEIQPLLLEWGKLPQPSLVHIRWAEAEGAVLLPGNGAEPDHSFFITHGSVLEQQKAYKEFAHWHEPACVLFRLQDDGQMAAWQDYDLHSAFGAMAEQVLARYQNFVGRSFLNKLAEDVNTLSRNRGWNIASFGDTISDQQIFDQLTDAVDAYQAIFRIMLEQITAVVGPKLTKSVLQEARGHLGQNLREALVSHAFLPSEIAAGGK